MDNLVRKMVIPPLVEKFEEIDKIRGTDVLLITYPDGSKFKMTYESLFKQLVAELEDKIGAQELPAITIEDIIRAFNEQSTINFVKPINILNNKIVEKNDKCIGAIYFNGEHVRICTKEGWKSLAYI